MRGRLLCETAVRLDDLVARDAGFSLEAVDVLGEELQQQPLLVQQVDERMRDGRSVFPWIQLLRKCVEG